MSGLNLRLKVAENKLEKSSQISAYSLKAQGLSGLKLRLSTCLRPLNFAGVDRRSENHLIFYFLPTP
ncbi:hypothetical protein P7G58_02990 [Globicatella sulfidifaciens]|uniref:hypothetical protein n=1 Tax=Globicatella sulfidifaciens TaxID=136093 RepID=UPI00288FA516|nr:hypothetical protein [Globicatella sulfidifaciens]MDT2767827.1 hypothetical protein [Globicatella sulfidifaciens]